MGAGGVIPPPATYFDKVTVLKSAYIYYEHGFTNVALSNTPQVQAVVKKYDILFIADEVFRYISIPALHFAWNPTLMLKSK